MGEFLGVRAGLLKPALPVMLVAVALAVFCASLAYAVRRLDPIYYYDGWAYMESLMGAMKEGHLSSYLQSIHRKHNEHRVGWVKLGLLADIWLTQGRLQLLSALNLGALSATGAVLGWIWSAGHGRAVRMTVGLFCAAAMLAPSSIENTSWPTQLQFPMMFLSGIAMMFAAAFIRPPLLLGACVFLLSVSSVYSMGSGLLAFVAAAALLMLHKRDPARALLVLVCGGAGAVLYVFPADINPQQIPGLEAVALSFHTLLYAGGYAGAAWRGHGLPTAVGIGCAALLVIVTANLFALWQVWVRGRRLDNVTCAMLAFGGLCLATALSVGLVRGTSDPVQYSLTSRYATGSIVTLLTAFILIARLVRHGQVVSVVLALALVPGLTLMSSSAQFMVMKHRVLRQVATSAQYGVADVETYVDAYPYINGLRRILADLHAFHLGFLSPAGQAQFTPPAGGASSDCGAGTAATFYRIGPDAIIATGVLPWEAFGREGWAVVRDGQGQTMGWAIPERSPMGLKANVFRIAARWPQGQAFEGQVDYVSADGARRCRLPLTVAPGRMFEVSGKDAFPRDPRPATYRLTLSGEAAEGGVPFSPLHPDSYTTRPVSHTQTGRIELAIDWSPDPQARLVIPVMSGGEPKRQRVTLVGEGPDGPVLLAAIEPRFLNHNTWYDLSFPAAAFTGSTARLIVEDAGTSWEEWTAIGRPFWSRDLPRQPGLKPSDLDEAQR